MARCAYASGGEQVTDDTLKLHPRHVPVETARRELSAFLVGLQEKHALTAAEYLSLLAGEIAGEAAMRVRHEREAAQ